ncbi:unnamed protein product [Arctia plantaginis]|uniref:Uncharacterized protein n=1 Tax=Arctia plantaginis TaxID=874455 RepID=A0A8S1AIY3_ARCPL|nr:unnamed protein product [Arctia plantaginis]
MLSRRCDEWQCARVTSSYRRGIVATSGDLAPSALSNAASFQRCISPSKDFTYRQAYNISTMFNIEKFILKVRERPALYDVQLP